MAALAATVSNEAYHGKMQGAKAKLNAFAHSPKLSPMLSRKLLYELVVVLSSP